MYRAAIAGIAVVVVVIGLSIIMLLDISSPAQTDERCFEETGLCISGRIREFWEQNGGLPVFGLPVTPLRAEVIEGENLQVQWFERNRLELHPDQTAPYDVLLGRLGHDLLVQQGRDWTTFPTSEAAAGCRIFEETGHAVCGDILAQWRASGLEFDGQPGTSEAESLALFGLPLSSVQMEEIDGRQYAVQWFERARFELHPENDPPYHVLLGLLGNEILAGDSATPIDPPTTMPLPPTTPIAPTGEWPTIDLQNPVSGFVQPTHITHAGDGSGRLFVINQQGIINIIRNGEVVPQPFLDIRTKVRSGGERGLLSIAFPPAYATKGHFYINYTDRNGDTVVARYRITDDPDIADPTSEQILLFVEQPYMNHNGGQLAFGPDGYLYIGMGDGGAGGDPGNRAQNPNDLLGKLLRIDVEGGATPYSIPPTNPFVGIDGYREEIWALGLRNPWRFSFDRQTGDLYIADVGESRYEEINMQPAASRGGENYGWNIMEGMHCFGADTCHQDGLTLPILEYEHRGSHCSITGGEISRNPAYPRMNGIYFYADYCSGHLWGLRPTPTGWENQLLYEAPFQITSFGEDEAGNIYVADYLRGMVWQLVDTAAE